MAIKTRRKLLTDSAALVAASTAAAMMPAPAAASQAAKRPPRVRHYNPAALAKPRGYTHVVDVTGGRTIYISGQVALDASGAVVGAGDLRAQTKQVFENLKAALDSVGATFADVMKFNFYLLDASQVQVVRDVRDTYIKGDLAPASTLVEVRRLAREEFLIEIDAIANIE